MTCRHCHLSDEIREYVERKTERLEKRFERLHGAEMILSVENGKTRAEMIVGLVRGQKCVAEAVDDDMHAAIDAVVDKVERQVRKLKGRLAGHKGQAAEQGESGEE
jgi:putative sigma-54 modulation protein